MSMLRPAGANSKFAGRNAKDAAGDSIQSDGFSHHPDIGSKPPLPQRVADQYHRAAARMIVFRQKRSPQSWLHAEHVKEIPTNQNCREAAPARRVRSH